MNFICFQKTIFHGIEPGGVFCWFYFFCFIFCLMNLNERNMMEEEVGERESTEKRREEEKKRKRKEEEEKGREKQRNGLIKKLKVENEELEAVRLGNEEEEKKRKGEEEGEEEKRKELKENSFQVCEFSSSLFFLFLGEREGEINGEKGRGAREGKREFHQFELFFSQKTNKQKNHSKYLKFLFSHN